VFYVVVWIYLVDSHPVIKSNFAIGTRGADKSLAQPGRKRATAKEDFDFHISYL